jgi:DNA (cytosine-5)-methyltransferase 1
LLLSVYLFFSPLECHVYKHTLCVKYDAPKDLAQQVDRKKFSIVELYAGTGRCAEPFRRWRRTNRVALFDLDKYAAKTYRKNFDGANYSILDLGRARASTIVTRAGGAVDILLGCPPCQGYSDCGKKDEEDPRNEHVLRFATYVAALRPLAFAMENVPLLATSQRFERFVQLAKAGGYDVVSTIANAALYGSCQSRQRLICIGLRSDLGVSPVIPEATHGGSGVRFSYTHGKLVNVRENAISVLGVAPGSWRAVHATIGRLYTGGRRAPLTLASQIGDLEELEPRARRRQGHVPWAHSPRVLRRMRDVPEGGQWRGKEYFSESYGRLHRSGLSRTITRFFPNAGSGRFWHPVENRALTLREAARIQGFPDSFRFLGSGMKDVDLVGNALDASLADIAFQSIREALQ